jgi:hypothetical protein
MSSDVKSVRLTASGTARIIRSRLKGVYVVHAASPGTVQVRDGGASGPILLELDLPSTNTSPVWVECPDNGILFDTDMYVTFGANITGVTVFYTS